ncbi:metal-dependent hydrolase [Planococcus sp. N028]|uniref:Metal-dependent hydrolase n=1 Tax=Planococcus shixiaomingii TaxID=3058393 RepID=A0ABT8N241_9BACL|nr:MULTISPECIES: metal-dependent hydrolase [unclassified Planococcus (in: firmicutes)]MDN7241963.1 metal-dependent hydrolase [Planococcus sp. N028]WKA54246.1 metal-dependent hydrolase [Planococcus sp. N022]
MTGKTHIIGGITASLAFAQTTNYDPFILVGAGVIGAILPDICHGGSKIGRTLPLLSKIINTLFGHRTFTHSLLFLVLMAALMNAFVPNEAFTAGILVGMASHLVLDMATKNGIKLLFPLSITVRFPITARTGGTAEYVVFTALSLFTVYFGYGVFIS